jgi:hypothetical protein
LSFFLRAQQVARHGLRCSAIWRWYPVGNRFCTSAAKLKFQPGRPSTVSGEPGQSCAGSLIWPR